MGMNGTYMIMATIVSIFILFAGFSVANKLWYVANGGFSGTVQNYSGKNTVGKLLWFTVLFWSCLLDI